MPSSQVTEKFARVRYPLAALIYSSALVATTVTRSNSTNGKTTTHVGVWCPTVAWV